MVYDKLAGLLRILLSELVRESVESASQRISSTDISSATIQAHTRSIRIAAVMNLGGLVINPPQRKNSKTVKLLVVLSLFTLGFAYSLEAPRPISLLVREADAVVVGRPIKAVAAGSLTSVSLIVERVIAEKAAVPRGTEIAFTASTPAGASSSGLPERALCFIRKGAGGWSVIPRIANGTEFAKWCFAALPERDITRLTSGKQTTDRILAEILLALAVSGPSSFHDLDQVLAAIPTTAYEEYIRLLDTPANNPIQLGLRLLYSDPSAVAELENTANLDPAVLAQVAHQMCLGYTSPSPAGIAALGRLALSNTSKRVRACAAYALRSIHVPEALPVLVQLMRDPDPDIRFEAVFGVAAAANSGRMPGERPLRNLGEVVERKQPQLSTGETQRHIPSIVEFRSNESMYIAFWTNWWLANRHKLLP